MKNTTKGTMQVNRFKTEFAATIFKTKYAQGPNDTWDALAERLVEDVFWIN